WRFGADAGVLAAYGLLPGLTFGALLAVALEPPRGWPIELSLAIWPYDRGYAAPGGARFLELTAGVALCPWLAGRRVSACAGLQAGAVRAAGFGFDRDERQLDAIADATLELRLDWPVT